MIIRRVTFAGHREVDDHRMVEKRLALEISNLMRNSDYVEFYMGRNGEFDIIAASVVRRLKKRYEMTTACSSLFCPIL